MNGYQKSCLRPRASARPPAGPTFFSRFPSCLTYLEHTNPSPFRMWHSVLDGAQSVLGRFPPSSTGASETHSSPAVAGYQPKNEMGKNLRPSSLPPSGVNASPVNDDKGLINTPSLDAHMSGQAEHEGRHNNPARKKAASLHADARPPKLPPTPPSAGLPSPGTPELAGTNVSFARIAGPQSPPSGGQEGPGGPVFYDIASNP